MNRNFPAICACMLMCAMLVLFIGGLALNPLSADASESCGITASVEEEKPEKKIYLTFDDGPSDRVTPKILDILKEENVKATFFIVGKSAERRKYIVEREFNEGHTVGVHSYSHVYKEIYASKKNLIADIDKCNALIEEVTGKPSNVYRFPGGSHNLSQRLISAVTEKGLKYVDWNASFCDSEIINPKPEQLYKAALRTVSKPNNVVMLAHDTTDKTTTAEALRAVIRHFKEKGYSFERF